VARAKGGETVRGYQLIRDFKMAGGGNCEWTFATKDGREYFIKRFLNPKYPKPDGPGSEKTKSLMREACEHFERHQRELNDAVKSVAGTSGRLVAASDFFREDNLFYKVAVKVPAENISPAEIAKLPLEKKIGLLQNVCTAVSTLHGKKIVHGDLKVDNALLEKSGRDELFIARLIDFDSSYFSQKPPAVEEMMGDPPYYSPELLNYVQEKDDDHSKLTTQSDMFALGLVFHQYLTGNMPSFAGDHKYVCEAVRAGYVVEPDSLDTSLPNGMRILISSMLKYNPADRPSALTVTIQLKEIRSNPDFLPTATRTDTPRPETVISVTPERVPKPGLRGTGIPKGETPSDKPSKEEGVSKGPLKVPVPTEKEPSAGKGKAPVRIKDGSPVIDEPKESVIAKTSFDVSPTYRDTLGKLVNSLNVLESVVNAKVSPPSVPSRIKGTMARVVNKLSADEVASIDEVNQSINHLHEHADAVVAWLTGDLPERPKLKMFISDHVVELVEEVKSIDAMPDPVETPAEISESLVPVEEKKFDDFEGSSSIIITDDESKTIVPSGEIDDLIKDPEPPSIELSEPDSTVSADESGSTRRLERLKSRGDSTRS